MRTFVDLRAVVRSVAWLLVAGLVLASPAAIVTGQETPAANARAADTKTAKKRAEPRGRLPAYFGEVVSADQREKIYDLQSKYLAQIAKLQDEIATLEEARDKEVLGVLTPEQFGKVKQLQDEAKAKRSAAATRKKGEAAPAAPGGETERR
jgi:hypothetical protein